MNDDDKIRWKQKLKDFCLGQLQERLATAGHLVSTAQESANNEGKSSAGDKYETGRAMGHLQKEMYQQQEANIRQDVLSASSTDVKLQPGIVRKGSVIITPELLIYVCVGLGRKTIADQTVFFISEESPLFRLLQNKQPGSYFLLGDTQKLISEIW